MRKWWTTGFVSLGIILLSLPELFVEAKHGMENYGYLGGAIIALYYIHKAYTRHQFRERDKRWEADRQSILLNQRVMMDKAGVGDAWIGPQEISKRGDLLNSRRFFLFYYKAINRVNPSRRRRKMNINFVTLAPGIIAVLKLVFQSLGIEIPDEHINSIVNGAAALMAVIAVIMSHRKPQQQTILHIGGGTNESTQRPGDSGAAV